MELLRNYLSERKKQINKKIKSTEITVIQFHSNLFIPLDSTSSSIIIVILLNRKCNFFTYALQISVTLKGIILNMTSYISLPIFKY